MEENVSTDVMDNEIATTTLTPIKEDEFCAGREKLKSQPVKTNTSRLKKCCPNNESLHYKSDTNQYFCETDEHLFQPEIVDVTMYDNCIEDNEVPIDLEILVGNPCNQSVLYAKRDNDSIFVLQNGSILITDGNHNESFHVSDNYCLDLDETGEIYAIVCVNSINGHLDKAQTFLFAISMLFSVPCLVFLAYIHFRIKELRTIHGLIVGCLTSCLAIGFTLHTIAQTSEHIKLILGYYVLFFMLWLNRTLGLALTTKLKGLPGMPSYFFQGFTDCTYFIYEVSDIAAIRESQRYFIPPVSFILFTCFGLLVATFFGFRKVEKFLSNTFEAIPVEDQEMLKNVKKVQMDRELYENSKKDAKCITFITFLIMIVWLLEVITFYSPGNEDSLAFLEILNGLQGMFILIIFMAIRSKRVIITHWWYDRGSAVITPLHNSK
uniref:G-protein coupled receptors family 2 profile 2 domain-containing protein n=1 Tax=Megaselia scalaris TaxID=36166 RepID=T1GWT3_MEGSC